MVSIKNIYYLVFFLVSLNSMGTAQPTIHKADIIIYGGSSAAVMAAVQAKRSGKDVIVVSPITHLGGLTSSGLGWTDTGNKEVIGGLAREFYQEVYNQYQEDDNWKWQKKSAYGNTGQGTVAMDGDKRTMWIFEPHIAENVFEKFIREHQIQVFRDEWLDRAVQIDMDKNRIKRFTTLSGNQYEGSMFIDATYEGDLMAAAGVSYHVGRESNATYGENWNGVQTEVFHHGHYFTEDVSPYRIPGDPSSGLLPRISADPPGKKGEGDHRIQAYCYRMCLTNHDPNRIPFAKPSGYDRDQYLLLERVYAYKWDETFQKFDPIPNRKTDTNNHGPFSTDNIGMNYGYPEGSYAERQKILDEHLQYQKGLMYFLSHDPSVTDDVRKEMATWGLSKDEFADNGHWPYKIYVREARRMLGTYVMTEHDVQSTREVPKPIGMGSYAMDSHNVQRYVKPDGHVQNEGDIGVKPKTPYQISYDALTPRKNECINLMVPICLSSSHIAYGSIRMEPVFMILGQSAAMGASIAMDKNIAVQDVDYADLKNELEKVQQVLSYHK